VAQVHRSQLGTPQSEDRLVYARPDEPQWGYSARVTDDGAFLVVTTWVGTDERYQIARRDLQDADSQFVTLIEGFDYDYTLIGSVGRELIFRTNNDAPRNRLIAIDVDRPAPEDWREIVPEATDVLSAASLVGGRLIASYMHDASTVVKLFELDGSDAGTVDLPGIGTAAGSTIPRRSSCFARSTRPGRSAASRSTRATSRRCESRRSILTRPTMSSSRSSIPHVTAPACRCSCPVTGIRPSTAIHRPCFTDMAASTSR
jgi:prolyl oligopeptidase PreP (S9A serine peptidase family)